MAEQVKPNSEPQMQVALGTLLEAATDKNPAVAEKVNTSLRKIAEKHPNQVLLSCCRFGQHIQKTDSAHLVAVLVIMERICQDRISSIDSDTIVLVIDFSIEVMTQNLSYEPQVQMPASEILVALGHKHYKQVMEVLLKKLEMGVVPHYMIPHTLGALAASNAFGVVPYLKNILNIMLPLLGGLRSDPLRQAFAYAFGCFCDALIEYIMNSEQSPDPTISIEDFYKEIGESYDYLCSNWLHSREPKVVESVLYSLSSMFGVLSTEKVNQQTPKIVRILLNMYRKHGHTYVVTKCLGSVILTAARTNGVLLEALLSDILQALSEIVCVSPDYAHPDSLRSHSEVLRCYECLANHFTDHTVDHLIGQLKNNNERERIRALLVLTHLTNSSESAIHSRSKDLIKYLGDMLSETNIKVKKTLLKAIVAFACKGFLLNRDINPQGPEKFMEFILKLCCRQTIPKNNEIDPQELWDIQKSADNTLYMLSTSVLDLQDTLWDLLLRCFLNHSYDDAKIVLLRCLTHLASKKTTMENCEAVFVRCLALLVRPLADFKGNFVLNFLKHVKLCKSGAYKTVFEAKVPQLLNYLEQNYDSLNDAEWQDLVLDFFTLVVETVKDDRFNEGLIQKAKEQLSYYNSNRNMGSTDSSQRLAEKRLILKCIAITACHLKDKTHVLQTLDIILGNVRLNDVIELQSCAEAVGTCSRQHLQVVLDKLAIIRKEVLLKRTSKFLNFHFIKDSKSESEIEKVRYVVILSYSEICKEAPAEQLLRIVEHEILDFVVAELNNCKDFAIRKACLTAIGSVADAMHPNRNTLHIRLQERDGVLKLVSSQVQLHSGPEYIELFPTIIPVLTSLSRLPLPLESKQRQELLQLCFDNVFNSSAIYCKINPESLDSYYGDAKLVPYITKSFAKVNQLVQELLMQNLSPGTLDEIVTLLEGWLNRKKMEQRLPAIETLRVVLQTYLDNMKFAYDTPSSFGQTGGLLAKIVPRCTDSNKNIRKVAMECLYLVLCIASRYEGHSRDRDKILSNSLQHIQQDIDTDEPKLLYNLTVDLAQVISNNMPQFQLSHFVFGLIDGLMDREESSAAGTSVVLNMILKSKGAELTSHVNEVFTGLIQQLECVQSTRARASGLRAVLSLAAQHSKSAAGVILNQSLPYNQTVCDCWSVLSTDQTLVLDLLDQLKKTIKHTPAYEEQPNKTRLASLQSLQAISALHELFKNNQLKDVCRQQYPEIFSLLLITLASYIGTNFPASKQTTSKKEKYGFVLNRDAYKQNPAKVALETFKLFLLCCDYQKIATSLLLCTQLDEDKDLQNYQVMLENLSDSVCTETPQSLSWMVACLGPNIRADLEPQRIAVVAFLANILRQRANDQTILAENLLEMLLDVQSDSNCTVRKLGLRGLGYGVEYLNIDLVARHSNAILSALMQGLDYSNVSTESEVILEALLSFSKLLRSMEGQRLSSFQITAAVRIKPLLSQEDVELRRGAFKLLGDLPLSLHNESNTEAFKEQIQGNLITLLLHLCDPDVQVVKSCKYTLRKVGPFLDSPRVNSMLQEHLVDEGNLHYDNFITDFVKIMAEELQDLFPLFIMTCLSYFKSPWVEIRSHAALFAGLLYSNLRGDGRPHVSMDTVCDRLLKLTKDENAEVRMMAVQATAYLFVN